MVAAILLVLFSVEPAVVLQRTAAAYERLLSYEVSASLEVKVPGQDLIIRTAQVDVHARGAMLPVDCLIPELRVGRIGGPLAFRNSAGEAVKAKVDGFGIEQFPFSSLDTADTRVISVRGLPDETLVIGGESIPCAVLEVLYQKRSPFDVGLGRPVRLWIDEKTFLVRQAVYEREWPGGKMAQWTARVEKITVDQPPPQWALDRVPFIKGREEPKWVGQKAPAVTLETLEGRDVSLESLRGKPVVLNIWATWCGPCREEMPLIEKLREEMKGKVEIWGITDEKPETARRWLAERKRTLATLIDSDRALFRHFGIESIPVLMLMRADGTISSYIVGMCGERDLRAHIAKAAQ